MKSRILLILTRGGVGTVVLCMAIGVVGELKSKLQMNLDWVIVLLLMIGAVFAVVFVGDPLSEEFERQKSKKK